MVNGKRPVQWLAFGVLGLDRETNDGARARDTSLPSNLGSVSSILGHDQHILAHYR